MQIKIFSIPVVGNEQLTADLNRFLRSKKIFNCPPLRGNDFYSHIGLLGEVGDRLDREVFLNIPPP